MNALATHATVAKAGMSATALFGTSISLGIFVLAGGAYGVFYGAGLLRSSRLLERAGYACYLAQWLVTLVICVASPLASFWKVFLVLSAAAYGFIPPVTWRLVEALHRQEPRTP